MQAQKKLVVAANAAFHDGGLGLNLFHIVSGLKNDFDVTVYCRGGVSPVPSVRVDPHRGSALLAQLPLLRRLRDWQNYLSDSHFDRAVAGAIPSAQLFHGDTGQCLSSLKTARRLGIPTVLDVVTHHVDDFVAAMEAECPQFRVRTALNTFYAQRVKAEYQLADAIRVMSEPARQSFLRRGFDGDRVVSIPPPFDLSTFPLATHVGDVFRVTFVGLIEPWKGFHYLVEAFGRLPAPAQLIFWGGTGSRGVARFFAEAMEHDPRITLRPVPVRSVGLDKVYGEASVLVLPSLSDGFGYVVAEAMACGVPVITTPQTGASQLIQDGVNGYLVDGRNVEMITDRLRRLQTDTELRRRLGQAARTAVQTLSPQRFQADYVSLVRRIF